VTRLHEILAVSGDLATTAKKVNDEAIGTFSKKPDLFLRSVTSVEHLSDDERNQDTTDTKEMTTTVFEKLNYIVRANVRALDVYMQKEATNQKAHADIVVNDGENDVTIAKDVPATVLLGLETKLAELRSVYESIPTLAPGPSWQADPAQRHGAYKSEHPDVRFRTRKTMRAFQLSPATQHHPAQVQAINEDVPIAKIIVQTWSGMITSAQKSDLLDRIDRLIRATKRARQRANMQDVEKVSLGDALFKHIHSGIVT
jgi:hypothetical protein